MGKFQVFIEFSGDPDFSGLIAAMVGFILGCIIRIPGNIFEKCSDFFEEFLLVVLGGKMVMCFSFFNDVFGKITLS